MLYWIDPLFKMEDRTSPPHPNKACVSPRVYSVFCSGQHGVHDKQQCIAVVAGENPAKCGGTII